MSEQLEKVKKLTNEYLEKQLEMIEETRLLNDEELTEFNTWFDENVLFKKFMRRLEEIPEERRKR